MFSLTRPILLLLLLLLFWKGNVLPYVTAIRFRPSVFENLAELNTEWGTFNSELNGMTMRLFSNPLDARTLVQESQRMQRFIGPSIADQFRTVFSRLPLSVDALRQGIVTRLHWFGLTTNEIQSMAHGILTEDFRSFCAHMHLECPATPIHGRRLQESRAPHSVSITVTSILLGGILFTILAHLIRRTPDLLAFAIPRAIAVAVILVLWLKIGFVSILLFTSVYFVLDILLFISLQNLFNHRKFRHLEANAYGLFVSAKPVMDECPVCLEDIGASREESVLFKFKQCQHGGHKACVELWLKKAMENYSDWSPQCFLCREPLSSDM